ncbi:MarR family winged helix-turn-helix transcriptional regulator [Endozoicomonas sp.]|uniref:MarR family winged helix-turn-helix transcriptional regulator n=1 Tax=Endozoicomonas sp. TaxID=1892382 RepID=UPI0028885AC8|nr:MarR family transcriptional regulator [Endozoicomonas sp.]
MLIDQLSKLGDHCREAFEQLIQSLPEKVTSREALLLSLLFEKKSMLPKEVAKTFGVTPGLITRYITSLVKKGFIERQPGDELRSYRIVITDRGANVAERLEQKKQWLNQQMEQQLTKAELASLIKIIDKISRSPAGLPATRK